MNWNKLQEMQLALDNAILQAKPKMTVEERFNKTLVALSVEVAEISNCSEHFKFWKDNKGKVDDKRFFKCKSPYFKEPYYFDRFKNDNNRLSFEQVHKLTLVEECSDALHFILSLANQLKVEVGGFNLISTNSNKEIAYLLLQANITDTIVGISEPDNEWLSRVVDWFYYYITELGVTEQELEQAYYEKNKVNYERLREWY